MLAQYLDLIIFLKAVDIARGIWRRNTFESKPDDGRTTRANPAHGWHTREPLSTKHERLGGGGRAGCAGPCARWDVG
jgi:hypothetical protein